MNKTKINNLVQGGNIVIPLYMFRLHKKYNLNLDEFVFLMYLYNKKFNVFDPELISNELNLDIMEVMGYISVLADKGLITLDISKEDGIITEKISIDNFLDNVSTSLIGDIVSEKEESNNNIYKEIEEAFKRKLSTVEIEIVKEWQDNDISDDLIREALKEAVLSDVDSLRYIDRILFEWHKKGISSKEDIKNEKKEEMEIFNCNWLEEDDEEI